MKCFHSCAWWEEHIKQGVEDKISVAVYESGRFDDIWNDWYQSMMFMDNSKDATLQYYLVRILDNVSFAKNNASSSGGLSAMMNVPDEGIQMATCVLAAGPMLCVFPFFQKYFVSGITVGSVKG